MPQRDLTLPRSRQHAAVQAVEALQAAAGVVMAVRALSIPYALAGELDLVGRVVHEEPWLRRVAQPELQRHSREHECGCHGDARHRERPSTPGTDDHSRDGKPGDTAAGQHCDRPQQPEVPALVSEPDEERKRPGRVNDPGPKVPWVRTERVDVQQHDGGERREHDPRALARDRAHLRVREPWNAARSPFREK